MRIKGTSGEVIHHQKTVISIGANGPDVRHRDGLTSGEQFKLVGFRRKDGQQLAAVAFDKKIAPCKAHMPGGVDLTAGKLVPELDFPFAKGFTQQTTYRLPHNVSPHVFCQIIRLAH